MTSNSRFVHRCALICAALAFGFVEAARANFLDDIGDFFSGNAPEVASSAACRSYAQAAVNVANGARSNNCPLTGHRYGTNQQGHYWWCMGVTPETSREEDYARSRQYTACIDNLIKCDAYGAYASRAAYNNRLYNCGFSGPRWGEDPQGHRNYCLSEKIIQKDRGEFSYWPDAETDFRIDAVSKCTKPYSKKQVQFCNSYATQAVASAKTFKEKNCNPSQNGMGRWDTDYAPHFSWCIRSGPWNVPTTRLAKTAVDSANAETSIRSSVVEACLAPLKSVGSGGGKKPTLVGGGKKPPSGITNDLSDFVKTTPSNPPSKPTPKGNSGPGTGGAYLSKPVDGNSAMDRLGGGGGASGGSSSGVSTSRPSPRPSGGGSSSGVNLSAPISPPSGGGSSSGISTSKPISPPSGGSSSGVYLSKPVSPPSGGSSSGVYLSKPGR